MSRGHTPLVLLFLWLGYPSSGVTVVADDPRRGPQTVFPGQDWEQATPESQGFDGQKLKGAIAHLEANTGGDGSRRLVIIRHGRVVWHGDDIDTVQGIWSCTKSFTSTALGLLVDDGKCSLDTRAADVLPAMRESYPDLTLRHFATMTSGYRAVGDEATEGYTHGPSPTPFVPHPKPLFEPGRAYAYWDSAMNQFALVLTKIAGEPLDELIKSRIAEPIGMNPAAWKWGTFDEVDGLRVNGGSGNKNKHVQISARELARFGLLFLNEGRWHGRQPFSRDWVKQATSVQVPATLENAWTKSDIDGLGCYGFNWWCNSMGPDKVLKWPGAPADTFAALGHNNNKLYVIPSWNTVIVRLGLDQAQKKISDRAQGEFLRLVGLAIQDNGVKPVALVQSTPAANQQSGNHQIAMGGELKQWHKVTLTLDGPRANELDRDPNPFTDYSFTVNFVHETGAPKYTVPGYFAADGNAAESSATSGNKWRAHLSPDAPGKWKYTVSFLKGRGVAVGGADSSSAANATATQTLAPFHGATGEFVIAPSDKQGRDFRALGRLAYVGKHYLQFQGTKQYFLKVGPDAPETLLAYADFDGTQPGRRRVARSGEATPNQTLHKYQPHVGDWREGDPTWKSGKGKGLVGALNYLSGKGMNTFSFLPYNCGGDGDNVWPFAERTDKLHYDCSKLDQWGIVFDHATRLGLHAHFKLQEHEIDDNRRGQEGGSEPVPESLDGGQLGVERKLYCRELVARYGHLLALNWNLGEENTQSPEEQRDMIRYIHDIDPYHHHIVIHSFPNWQDRVYSQLLGDKSLLTGASLQNDWSDAHERTLKWRKESATAGRPWVVANDEQGPASLGVPPADPGYQGHDGIARVRSNPNQKKKAAGEQKQSEPRETLGYTLDDIRKQTLWGTLMAGGAGVEYYFGYQLPQNDLVCEDFRSRDKSWDYCRFAIDFFRDNKMPFERMACMDELVGNEQHDNSRYCFAIPGEAYVVYLPGGGTTELDLSSVSSSSLTVKWYNPRTGGPLLDGTIRSVTGSRGKASLGQPPNDPDRDWVVLVR